MDSTILPNPPNLQGCTHKFTRDRMIPLEASALLRQREQAGTVSGVAKVVRSEAFRRVSDRAVQVMGGGSVTGGTAMARITQEIRGLQVCGRSGEVHRLRPAQQIVTCGANR